MSIKKLFISSLLFLVIVFFLLLFLPWVEFVPKYDKQNSVDCRTGQACPTIPISKPTGFKLVITPFFGAKYFWSHYADTRFPAIPARFYYRYDVLDDAADKNTFSFLALFGLSVVISLLVTKMIVTKNV